MTGRGDCGEVPGEEGVGTRRGQELRTISHEERVRRKGAGRAWDRKEALPLVHNPCAKGMTQKGEREAGLRREVISPALRPGRWSSEGVVWKETQDSCSLKPRPLGLPHRGAALRKVPQTKSSRSDFCLIEV